MIKESKHLRIERDLEFKNPQGKTVYYDLIRAGLNPDYPEKIVIERSAKMPDANLAFVEHAVIVAFAKRKGIDVLQQAVYSDRGSDKYDLVRLEVKARSNDEKRTPQYGHRRDHGTLFSKQEVYADLKKIVAKAEHIEKQNQEVRTAGMGKGDSSLQDEIKKLREAAEQELKQELEQRKKR